jgi:hypothetical protein
MFWVCFSLSPLLMYTSHVVQCRVAAKELGNLEIRICPRQRHGTLILATPHSNSITQQHKALAGLFKFSSPWYLNNMKKKNSRMDILLSKCPAIFHRENFCWTRCCYPNILEIFCQCFTVQEWLSTNLFTLHCLIVWGEREMRSKVFS